MEDLVVGFPQGIRQMPCLILILIYHREGRVTYMYRQSRARGSLVTKEIDDIGGFMAKME
jgi:hypothetical protein